VEQQQQQQQLDQTNAAFGSLHVQVISHDTAAHSSTH
jgi:hypothetical protein